MKDLFVFYVDDTLISNIHDYAEPILDAIRLIVRTLGNKAPHVSKIMEMVEAIDARRVKETNPATGKPYLYSMERFPGSLVETYRKVCAHAHVLPDKQVEERLRAIGMQAFDQERYVASVHPCAVEVVRFLKRQGSNLILCTKGDFKVQHKKISALSSAGVLMSCDELLIVDDKTEELFRAMRASSTARRCYSIGNSYRSDIAPALAAGFYGVYIPVESWEMDGKTLEVDRARCVVLSDLGDIPAWYRRVACEN